jgi:predicted MFS family arabinose efflux permease
MTREAAHPLDRHFGRNVAGISLVELLWGLGMPVVFESTFLQIFLARLGASSLLIGLVPTLSSAGIALASLLSWTLTSHLERKRTAVILVHVATSLPLLAFGILLGAAGIRQSTLATFLVLYAVYSVAVGLILPVWQNYLMKIFSDSKAVPAMAVMMTMQSVAKLAGSLSLVRVVERYSFSAPGASLVFTLVGLVFLIGSFPFLLTVEEARHPSPGPRLAPPPVPARNPLRTLLSNRRFLSFLGTDLEYFALSGAIAFYANYATDFCGVSPALASGLFMACTYVGGVLANVLLGWADLLSLRGKYLVTKSLAVAGLVLMAFHSVTWVFFFASFLFGASRGTRLMMFAPAVKRLSGQADATLYFAVAPIIALPFSTALPLVIGAFLDGNAALGATSYRIVFLAMAALGLFGVFFSSRMRKE